nr:general transcription factor 3C polypeptide 3-like [Coffea arabica]
MEELEEGEGAGVIGSSSEFHADEHPMELESQLEEEEREVDDEGKGTTTANTTANIEGEEEDDDDEDEEEEGYKFRFSDDMDPLAFTKEDASGLQPYEQFQRLEHHYEALAAKKRKARLQPIPQGEVPVAKKPRQQQEDVSGATMEEIMELMNYGSRRRSRKPKRRGRRKGSRNKVSPEVTRKLGDATLHYAHGRYGEAIGVFYEVIRLSPNLPDPYHRLGLIYNEMGDKKRALDFYMIAAHLTPKDASFWKLLVTWSIEQGDTGQARYCLSKAITADPEDINLRFHRASLYVELGDYLKAADSYEQISQLCPDNVNVLQTAAQLYKKSGQSELAVRILESYLRNCCKEPDLNVVDILASLHMEGNAHKKALEHIEHAQQVYCTGKEMPLCLRTKAGICHIHLGNFVKAEALLNVLRHENLHDHPQLIIEIGDSLMNHGHYESALEYYMMLVGDDVKNNSCLYLKIAECCSCLGKRLQSIDYFYRALDKLENTVDARLALSSLLLEENKDDEAISVLCPPKESESLFNLNLNAAKPWWLNGKIKLRLSQIYKAKGLLEAFVDVIFPVVRETLFLETIQQKVRPRKRLSKSVLSERIKILDHVRTDTVFHGFRPVASASDLSRASRAKKLLKKKEAKRAAALAAGIEWISDDSEDESPQQAPRELPLPNLLRDAEHHYLIIELCKSLLSLKKYWEALEIINLTLKLASNVLSVERNEELRTLGAQIAYNIADPAHGFDYARYIVNQRPYSFSAWNCYYKVISKLDSRYSKHNKFLHTMRTKHKSCVPLTLIFGHQFTMISQHQAAVREYLEAHKLMPDIPLINLCAGTALINLALGHRLQNKHQSVVQGLAFLFNNLQLCRYGQEALYNIARAYHHVGLVSLAAVNYEKVLTMHESDCPMPNLPNEKPDGLASPKPGYCDLRREAAYNLHLIYKKSGAIDLARQILKDHCVI